MFTPDNGVFGIGLSSDKMFEVYIKNQIFNRLSTLSSVRKMSQRIIQTDLNLSSKNQLRTVRLENTLTLI